MAVLETSRLRLRPFTGDDLEALVALMANPDFMRFSLGPNTREQTMIVLEKLRKWDCDGLPSQFAVSLRTGAELIGFCGFLHQVLDETNEIEIAYRLHPEFWNRGLATEAARAVRDHGFRDWKLPRLISLIHPENTPSRRVAEKNGMTVEKETTFRGFPTLVFAITREQWLAWNAA